MHPYFTDGAATLYQGDALAVLRRLSDQSAACCVTVAGRASVTGARTSIYGVAWCECGETSERLDSDAERKRVAPASTKRPCGARSTGLPAHG